MAGGRLARQLSDVLSLAYVVVRHVDGSASDTSRLFMYTAWDGQSPCAVKLPARWQRVGEDFAR